MTLTTVNPALLDTQAQYTGFKNRVINGAMVIDQRNAGAEVNPVVNATYYLDRWAAFSTVASKFKIGQNAGSVTPPSAFTNYLGCTSLSAYTPLGAGDAFYLQQRIEGFNFADMAWGTASASTITLSFWVYSSLTGTFGGSLRNSGSTRSYPFSYAISSANTWEQKTITIAGDTSGTWLTTNGLGAGVAFSLGVGTTLSGTAGAWAAANYLSATGATSVVGTSGATFYITGVQLEKGSTATSFDYRPYGTELGLCQRYYEKSYSIDVAPATATDAGVFDLFGSTDGTANIVGYVKFSVAKRANPTMSFWTISGTSGQITYARSGATASGTATTYRLGTLSTCFYVGTGGNWVVSELVAHWAASSEL